MTERKLAALTLSVFVLGAAVTGGATVAIMSDEESVGLGFSAHVGNTGAGNAPADDAAGNAPSTAPGDGRPAEDGDGPGANDANRTDDTNRTEDEPATTTADESQTTTVDERPTTTADDTTTTSPGDGTTTAGNDERKESSIELVGPASVKFHAKAGATPDGRLVGST